MARVTVEDCIKNVDSRFELVALAAQRVRQIIAGSPITVDRDEDKNPVVALRELAQASVSANELKELVIKRYREVRSQEEEKADSINLEDDSIGIETVTMGDMEKAMEEKS